MAITTILFDLDGTLLPMDQDIFTKAYFKGIAEKTRPHGYDPTTLTSTIWEGTAAMVKNRGDKTNEEVFWDKFAETYGDQSLKDIPIFDEFYSNEFQQIKKVCGFNPKAAETIRMLKANGYRTALATNPIFPKVATESRIRWAGLNPNDFELYTTYENSRHCKPNPAYYSDILEQLDVQPEECLMIGNDVEEDMIAAKLGMKVFLLTDCLINKHDADISVFPNGSFDQLIEFISSI